MKCERHIKGKEWHFRIPNQKKRERERERIIIIVSN
jgi:hypothetical protein